MRSWGRWRKRLVEALKHVVMGTITGLVFYPFVMLIVVSFKNTDQFMHNPWFVTFPLHFANYPAALELLVRYAANSVFVSGVSCLGTVFLAAFTAYVFARFEFVGRQFLFYLIISLMMVPGILGLVPMFMIVKRLGLLNTYWALILPYIAGGQVLGIFLLRTFFSAIPSDLFDSAEIDGAGDFRTFISVAMPLCKPMMATIAIISFHGTWNDLIWPLVVISDDKLKTITIGLLAFQSRFQSYGVAVTQYGPLFAGYVVAAIPLLALFLCASRYFVEGLTSGALKA